MTRKGVSELLAMIDNVKDKAADIDSDKDRVLKFQRAITQACFPYTEIHKELVEKAKQVKITSFFLPKVSPSTSTPVASTSTTQQ